MGERQRSRDAVERLAVRIKAQGGVGMTADRAQREAAQVARRADQQREDGSMKNQKAKKG